MQVQVEQLMTPAPRVCGPDANLCEAVQMMWEGDFGALPIADDEGVVQGIVTDRDIAIALGTRNRVPCEVRVCDVMSSTVHTCRGDDGIGAALKTMREHRVRRLPVVDSKGRLCGMLSLDDVVLAGDTAVLPGELVDTFRRLCARQIPTPTPLVAVA